MRRNSTGNMRAANHFDCRQTLKEPLKWPHVPAGREKTYRLMDVKPMDSIRLAKVSTQYFTNPPAAVHFYQLRSRHYHTRARRPTPACTVMRWEQRVMAAGRFDAVSPSARCSFFIFFQTRFQFRTFRFEGSRKFQTFRLCCFSDKRTFSSVLSPRGVEHRSWGLQNKTKTFFYFFRVVWCHGYP